MTDHPARRGLPAAPAIGPIADGGTEACTLCRRHGHDDVNPPEGTIRVRTAEGEPTTLRVCRRCARETTFRNFEPFDPGGG